MTTLGGKNWCPLHFADVKTEAGDVVGLPRAGGGAGGTVGGGSRVTGAPPCPFDLRCCCRPGLSFCVLSNGMGVCVCVWPHTPLPEGLRTKDQTPVAGGHFTEAPKEAQTPHSSSRRLCPSPHGPPGLLAFPILWGSPCVCVSVSVCVGVLSVSLCCVSRCLCAAVWFSVSVSVCRPPSFSVYLCLSLSVVSPCV